MKIPPPLMLAIIAGAAWYFYTQRAGRPAPVANMQLVPGGRPPGFVDRPPGSTYEYL